MLITAGIDVGSTYTKVVVINEKKEILAKELNHTGFKLKEISRKTFDLCLSRAGLQTHHINYVIATGIGRHQVDFKNIYVTDLTAAAYGARHLFPKTRSVLDIGGQTMKASRLSESGAVSSFRLNDKCAAGTGAFLEKTARYMGFGTEEISPLLLTSKAPVPISGVCAVFAESEVINQLSLGTSPSDIMQGALESLVGRSAQLIKRVKAEPEYTLVGGIVRFETMAKAVQEEMKTKVNCPEPGMVQFVSAFGAALLALKRLEKIGTARTSEKMVHGF